MPWNCFLKTIFRFYFREKGASFVPKNIWTSSLRIWNTTRTRRSGLFIVGGFALAKGQLTVNEFNFPASTRPRWFEGFLKYLNQKESFRDTRVFPGFEAQYTSFYFCVNQDIISLRSIQCHNQSDGSGPGFKFEIFVRKNSAPLSPDLIDLHSVWRLESTLHCRI